MKTITPLLYGLILVGIFTHSEGSVAQVVPDSSLAGESSVVIPSMLPTGSQNEVVVGGARRDTNLFHSFETFSILGDQVLHFLEPEGVARIFTRVTGLSPSDIQGTLGVVSQSDIPGEVGTLGSADLFLINTNGVVFGPDSQLQLGGSFLASTASDIQFADGSKFTTSITASAPILTSDIPIGLGLRQASPITVENEGRAVVNNIYLDELTSRMGLAVLPTQTIALVGGGIDLNGGIIRTPSGTVELASVEDGFVSMEFLDSGFELNYESVQSFSNLDISRLSLIELNGIPAGAVNLVGRNISISDGSIIFARNIGSNVSGNISVLATESIQLGNTNLPDELLSGFISDNFGAGGADIFLQAPQILVQNGGQILTNNHAGRGGSIFIDAADYVQVDGFNPTSEGLVSFITSNGINQGNSGNLTLNAGEVRVLNGAQLGTIAADGIVGSVTINARDILVQGSLPTILKPSILGIATGGEGDSNRLVIDTNTLRVLDGGAVGTISIGAGDAGDTVIKASEFVEVAGSFPGAVNPSSIDSSVTAVNPITRVFLLIQPSVRLGGQAGSVSIDTPNLLVRDGGAVRVQNDGTGDAGNLVINSDKVQVLSEGSIFAVTSGGQGGNIEIDASTIFASDQATISASASGEGRGGNITIESDAITLANESAITANAIEGAGGQVMIQSNALFQSSNSAIAATSEAGPELNGVVDIRGQEETLQTEGQLNLPLEQPSIAITCTGASEEGLTSSGRGGLPVSPETIARQSWEGWNNSSDITSPPETSQSNQIIEAQGWIPNGDGTVRFVDYLPNPSVASNPTCVGNPPT